MNRKNFGRLLKKLRYEVIDLQTGKPFSQERLSEVVGIAEGTYQKIEQGISTVVLKPEMLVGLADALKLTTGERREFLAAAHGVESESLVSGKHDPIHTFDHCKKILSQLQAPAFVHDTYFDILAANRAVLELYGLHDYREWKNREIPINILDVIFRSIPEGKLSMKTYGKFIEKPVMLFRIQTLPYRTTKYFDCLITRLRTTYEGFWEEWQSARLLEDDQFLGYTLGFNRQGEWLQFIGSTIPFLTTYGTIKVITYTPVNMVTQQVFADILNKVGNQVVETATWPNKPNKLCNRSVPEVRRTYKQQCCRVIPWEKCVAPERLLNYENISD
ncbi:MAG: XRE family transcriptional regulator [Chloroflexi bacterium]|nr:MAG: XRE family transcriptional regulator [Chloroflexota bacterium]